MENNIKDKLNNFNKSESQENENIENDNTVVIKSTSDGLFERVDKTLVTKDGRQLLN